MTRKGIVLSGGTGSRFFPVTKAMSKQLLPVFDKPMIYYPLSALMLSGIKEFLVISTPNDLPMFRHLLGDGAQLGISIEYAEQRTPDGIARAITIAEPFLEGNPSALVLGDNLFYGANFSRLVQTAYWREAGATVFAHWVDDPSQYGVVEIDGDGKPIRLVEKPRDSVSNFAVTGLYFFDKHATEYVKQLTPSARGELEITDLNKAYLERGELNVTFLGRGYTWSDCGSASSLLEAASFVSMMENRQGLKICCPEEIAYRNGWIDIHQLDRLATALEKSSYGKYLKQIVFETNNPSRARP